MAKTGSIGITLNSQSIANNTSSITVRGTITTSGESYRGTHRTGTYTVKQGGTVIYNGSFTCGAPANSTTTLFSKTLVVTHDAVGKSGDISVSYNYDSGWCTASGSAGLPTIPRKSELTVGNGTLGTAQTLTVTRKSTTFSHTITATCGSASTTICTKSTATSISFTPPLAWASQNASGGSVSVKYTITTYNGSTSIGSNTYTVTCAIPSSVKPTVSFTVEDGNGYLSTYGGYIKSKSTFKIKITASGAEGSTIKSYKTTADGKTYTESEFTSLVVSGSGTIQISVTVTDSRGRTATVSESVTVLPYASPKINSLKAERCDSDGTANSNGAYLKVVFASEITPLDSKNSASYTLEYKKKTDTGYTTVALSDYANQYSVTNGTYIFAADTASSYDIVLRSTDDFSTTPSTATGSTTKKFFSFLAKGMGIALGKVAEKVGLEVDWDAYFNKKLYIGETDVGAKLDELNNNLTFITGTFTASTEDEFLLARFQEFLNTQKKHCFISVVYDGTDYYTGTLSRYASGSMQGIILRAGAGTTFRVKSNGSTITKTTIT